MKKISKELTKYVYDAVWEHTREYVRAMYDGGNTQILISAIYKNDLQLIVNNRVRVRVWNCVLFKAHNANKK